MNFSLFQRVGRFALVEDVKGDGQQQHYALDELLVVDADAKQGHAVVQDAHDESTGDGPDHCAHAAGDGGPTDEGCGDGIKLEEGTGARSCRIQPSGEDQSRQCSQYAHIDEKPEVDVPRFHTRQLCGLQVPTAGVNMTTED